MEIGLDNFYDDDIEEYAKDRLDMVKRGSVNIEEEFSIPEVEEFLVSKGVVLDKQFYYPNNSIVLYSAYQTLLNNVDKIPLSEIENLITKYNCI